MREVEVLGTVRVSGTDLTSPTQLTLLSVLAAAAPYPLPFHRLIDAVWERPPASAENSLHSHLSRLRGVLGPGAVIREHGTYRLVAPIDAANFQAAVADQTDERGSPDRRRRLSEALAAWRGRPFGDYADHPYVRLAAESLSATRCAAMRELAMSDVNDGDPLTAVSRLRTLVAEDFLDEESWALLVEALDAGGRRAEALRVVQEAVGHLADVGLGPSDRLRDAEALVLGSGESRTRRDLPRPASPLIGRDAIAAEVAAVVGPVGWTTLVGPGGVGKTRLALEVAERHEGRVAFADLTEAAGEDVEITVARATGVPLRPPYIERIATRMMVEPTLLVLDCCEAAVDHVAALGAQLMALCPSMSVLATSRTPVGVPGEGLIEIEPLESADAVEMLRQRVVHAGIPPPPDEVLGDLCARVDCLPLTIEMLAGAMRSLSDDELLDADSDPLSLLGGRDGDLASSVARSVDLLDRAERVTFERLSMFRAPFVLDTASGVIARPEHPRAVDHLRSLRDRSLVSVVDTRAGRRLRMLDTVRAVARRSLEERDDPQAAKQFVSVFRARGRQIDEGLRTPAEVRWLWVAAAEMADLRSAHRIALESGDTDAAAEIAGSMFHLVYDRLRPDLAQWSEETIDVVGISHPLAPRLLGAAALGAMHVDDYDRAWRWVERARSGAPISPYVELAAANLTLRSGDLESTERAAEQVVATSAASGDDYTVAIGHLLRALAHGYRGDLERGLEIAREQRRVSRRVGAPTLLAYADYLEGELRSETEPVVALELLHRARTRATKCASPLAEGVALVTTTTIRARASDESGADLDFASTMRHWRDRGDWNLQWATVRNFAEYLARTGRYEAAATIIGAIDAHGSPAFGAEAIRLDAARQLMGSRVDTERTALLAARGRSMTGEELLSYALEAADHPIGQDGSLA